MGEGQITIGKKLQKMICSGQGVRLTLSSRISNFASSYWYLFCLRMNMELIIYCRPRQAILKFANRYPNTNQTAFCTTLYNLKIQRFCHRVICTNKKHMKQHTQRKSPTERNITLTARNYYNSGRAMARIYCRST